MRSTIVKSKLRGNFQEKGTSDPLLFKLWLNSVTIFELHKIHKISNCTYCTIEKLYILLQK